MPFPLLSKNVSVWQALCRYSWIHTCMKKVAQTYSLIGIVKICSNVWSLKREFGKGCWNVLHPILSPRLPQSCLGPPVKNSVHPLRLQNRANKNSTYQKYLILCPFDKQSILSLSFRKKVFIYNLYMNCYPQLFIKIAEFFNFYTGFYHKKKGILILYQSQSVIRPSLFLKLYFLINPWIFACI